MFYYIIYIYIYIYIYIILYYLYIYLYYIISNVFSYLSCLSPKLISKKNVLKISVISLSFDTISSFSTKIALLSCFCFSEKNGLIFFQKFLLSLNILIFKF